MTELHYAAYCGHLAGLQDSLKLGLDINQKDEYRGYTPLHWLADMAATGGPRVKMLKLLVKHGADVNCQDDSGNTALMLACISGSYEGNDMVPELLALGASATLRSATSTCLHVGIWNSDLLRQFIAAGASLSERDEDGLTPLELAKDRLAKWGDEDDGSMLKIVAMLEKASRRGAAPKARKKKTEK